MKLITQFIALILLALFITPAGFSEDVEGSKDYPMVSRYEGSSIV